MTRPVEIHIGCGGIVKLGHETWRCQRCRAVPVPVSSTRLRRAVAFPGSTLAYVGERVALRG